MDILSTEEKQLIAEIEGKLGTGPIFLLKFTDYPMDIFKGKLHAGTPAGFRKLEQDKRKRGQGDANELLCISKGNIEAENLFKLDNAKITFWYPEDDDKPIVAFTGFALREMKIETVDKDRAVLRFPCTKEMLQEMRMEFGVACTIIAVSKLWERVFKYCSENNVQAIGGRIKYRPQNDPERQKAFYDRLPERFLYKDRDKDLIYQNEYRIAFDMPMPEDGFIHLIGFQDEECAITATESVVDAKIVVNRDEQSIYLDTEPQWPAKWSTRSYGQQTSERTRGYRYN